LEIERLSLVAQFILMIQ